MNNRRVTRLGGGLSGPEVVLSYPPNLLSFARSTPSGDWSVDTSESAPGLIIDLSNTTSTERDTLIGNDVPHDRTTVRGDRYATHFYRYKGISNHDA